MAFEIIDANTIFGPWPVVRADMPVERLVAALQNHGVVRSVAISTVGAMHNHNDGNAETLRLCADKPQLTPAATIDPRGYFGQRGLVAKLKEQGFGVLRFFPLVQSWNLELSSFVDILDDAEPVGMPMMTQSEQTGMPSALAKSLGGRTAPMILEGVEFANMAEAVSVMRKHPNVFVETSRLRVPGALRFLVDQVGPDRVIFGSGCLRNSLAAASRYIVDSEITDEQKAAILGGNIKRLIGG